MTLTENSDENVFSIAFKIDDRLLNTYLGRRQPKKIWRIPPRHPSQVDDDQFWKEQTTIIAFPMLTTAADTILLDPQSLSIILQR